MRTRQDSRLWVLGLVGLGILGLGSLLLVPGKSSSPEPVETQRPAIDRTAAEIDPDFVLGVELMQAGRHHDALIAFQRFIDRSPRVPEAYVNVGFAYVALDRLDAARQAFDLAIGIRPEQANAYFGLALVHEKNGDLDLARGAMRTFAHLAPDDDPYVRLAQSALWEWGDAGAIEGGD